MIAKRGAFILSLFGLLNQLQAATPESLKLEPILFAKGTNGRESLFTLSPPHMPASKPHLVSTAFLAVVSVQWPEGLVPIFRIEHDDGRLELRRVPRQGQDSNSEPLFFALPREDETNASRIAGRWHCTATNAQRSSHSPDFELAIDDERVGGRFDPMGEYRVAFITGGTFRSNCLELTVDYINDRFFLTGEWHDGKLSGTWRAHDDMDRGKWVATRSQPAPTLPTGRAVVLYEWRNAAGHRRYSIEEKMPGWTKEAKPLCRVWMAE